MSKEKVTVEELHNSTSGCTEFSLSPDMSTADYVDHVAIQSKMYSTLFKHGNGYSYAVRRTAIVKISAPGKRTIWRVALTKGVKGLSYNKIGLPFSALWEMGKTDAPFEATIEKGTIFPYYWHHPVPATRISTRIGFVSLALSIISLVFSWLGSICCCA